LIACDVIAIGLFIDSTIVDMATAFNNIDTCRSYHSLISLPLRRAIDRESDGQNASSVGQT
jgi:hypothetical protein